MFTKQERQFLSELARKSIRRWLEQREKLTVAGEDVPENCKAPAACFVTLTIDGELRGCIGTLTAVEPLYKAVISNAISAAFGDPRFPPLTEEEFKKTAIEISVLEEPKPFSYKNMEELLMYLAKEKPGVVLKKGRYSATFLPQVWEELQTPEEFLSHLCAKAGLTRDSWRAGDPAISVYGAELIFGSTVI